MTLAWDDAPPLSFAFRSEKAGNDVAMPDLPAVAQKKVGMLREALKASGLKKDELDLCLFRLLFCLFANSLGFFPPRFLQKRLSATRPDGSDLPALLNLLFTVLGTPRHARRQPLSPLLFSLPHMDSGLFARIAPLQKLNAEARAQLLDCLSFGWNSLPPVLFGLLAQTNGENANLPLWDNSLKLLNPLCLNSLRRQFEDADTPAQLDGLRRSLSSLQFLDPACGSGIFLIVAYARIRRLEIEIARRLPLANPAPQVRVGNFHGLELRESLCMLCRAGLWLMDRILNREMAAVLGGHFAYARFLPNIIQGNALRLDWTKIADFSFIIGKPPCSAGNAQAADCARLFGKNFPLPSYSACWLKKASDFMRQKRQCRTAFVTDCRLCQGEHAHMLWDAILRDGQHMDFAWHSFPWRRQRNCVIVGFSSMATRKLIFAGRKAIVAAHINSHLLNAPDIQLPNRPSPLCHAPRLDLGNKPADGGNYLFSAKEMTDFIKIEPQAAPLFRAWLGASEFLSGKSRYCLWLQKCPPAQIKKMPACLKRMEAVREYRLGSKSVATQRLAANPRNFQSVNLHHKKYLAIPRISPENRDYLPIAFLEPDCLAGDSMLTAADATLYHFGILSSALHGSWFRTVCAMRGENCRYSREFVYNNFPWPSADMAQEQKISALAKKILATRTKFPHLSLGEMYSAQSMPPDLLAAHRNLDDAVMELYGCRSRDWHGIVAMLLELYQNLARSRQMDKEPDAQKLMQC